MDAMRLAFNPGDGFTPQRLFAMRVNNATRSTLTLQDGSANDMVKFTSLDYGLHTTQINVTVESGTNYGKKITVKFKGDSEVFDDVRRQSLTITHSSATVTITNNSSTQELSASNGDFTLDLNAYPTIGDLAAYISDQTDWDASVISGQADASSLELDSVSTQSVSGGHTFESSMQAIVDAVNSGSQLIEAEAVNDTNDRVVPSNISLTYMSGGGEGGYTSSEWSDALSALEAENVQLIATPNTDSAIHSSIQSHCVSMSSVTGKKERQALVGGTTGETVSEANTNSSNLNTETMLYAYNGGYQFDINGNRTLYSAGYAACMLGAMKTVMALNEPLTYKTLNFLETESKLKDSDLEQLILGGVAPIAYNSNGVPHMVRQVTTYQATDLKYNEFSMVFEMFYVSRDLRAFLQRQFTGRPSTAVVGGILVGAVESRLQEYVDLGLFTTGPEGAFWNTRVVLNGDVADIDYDAYITTPVNFQFVTQHFHEPVNIAA